MIYFTSDTHYNHAKIIEYSKRPFRDVSHMNEEMIRIWNETVQSTDTVIHLGDFAMGNKKDHKSFLDRLGGYKILIRGNHDQDEAKMLAMGWNEVYLDKVIEPDGLKVYLRHIPPKHLDPYANRFYHTEFMKEPPPYFDYWLCGHVHEKFLRHGKVINVGVDRWDFKPRTFRELVAAVDAGPDLVYGSSDGPTADRQGS